MQLKGKKIGFVLTEVFYTFNKIIPKIEDLIKKEADIIPIISFDNSNIIEDKLLQEYIKELEKITNRKVLKTINEVKDIGPKNMTDLMIIAPCSSNTISKIACNITDTPVTVAVNSHLRNGLPIVLGLSSNNGLSDNAENIGRLLNRKNYYFVPFRQKNPITKPRAIMFDPEYIAKTIEYALENEQISPILL